MYIGSDEIGLEEKLKYKGSAEFSFSPQDAVKIDLEVSGEKRKKVIKAEINNATRRNKSKSRDLF